MTMSEYNYDEIKQEISRLETEIEKEEYIIEELTPSQDPLAEQYEPDDFEQNYPLPPIESDIEYQLSLHEYNIANFKMQEYCYQDILELLDEGDDYQRIYSNNQFEGVIKSHDGFVEKDLLNRKREAQNVADKILRENIKSTAVFGKWGTGKTAFLKFIREGLESGANSNNCNIATITIDASAYSDQNQIWAYIYENVREEFSSRFINRVKYMIWYHWLLLLAIVALPLFMHKGVPFILEQPFFQKIKNPFGFFIKNYGVIKQFIDVAAILGVVFKLLPLLFKGCRLTVKKALSYTIPRYSDSLGVKLKIRDDLNKILNVWKKDIFFMVDELDRSDDKTILDFFDAIQLFQNKRIHLIYAIDQDVLYKALKNKKGFTSSETDSFLKKYIDYSYLLKGINKDSKALGELTSSYNFTKTEKIIIVMALIKLNVSLSIREVIHVLNLLNQIKEDWLKKEIFTSQYKLVGKKVLNFQKFIPWAIYHYTESEWTKSIEQDFVFNDEDLTLSLGRYITCLKDKALKKKYEDCPNYFKDSIIHNIVIYMEWTAKYRFI